MAGYIGSKSSVTQVDGYTEAEADAEFVNDPNGAITVSGSNVGIGTSSPANKLHTFSGSSTATVAKFAATNYGNAGTTYIEIGTQYGDGSSRIGNINPSGNLGTLVFETMTGTSGVFDERLRIDSSGNVLVGTDDINPFDNTTGSGIALRSTGAIYNAIANGTPLALNRMSSDGTIANFFKDGSSKGSIGTNGGSSRLFIAGAVCGLYFGGGDILPTNSSGTPNDNAVDLGSSTVRFDDVFATNGTIQTSDFNEKQDIATLTATEMLVGKRISALFKTFRWKDKVLEKGDNARTHTGIIAQDVQAAFTAEGLDAGDYALFISSTWWEHDVDVPAVEAVAEVLDEDGNVTTEAVEAVDAYTRTDTYDTEAEAPEGAISKTRMGIRYPELLSFVAAYNEQRFASIEARLTALEA